MTAPNLKSLPVVARARPLRLPEHCRSTARRSEVVERMRRMLRRRKLHSVCEEAHCPNLNHCFGRGTVTRIGATNLADVMPFVPRNIV